MKKIKLDIVGLSYSQTQSGAYALVLGEQKGKRRLPIIIGSYEAQAIAVALEKMPPQRPLTHDLFKTMSDNFGIEVKEVIIHNLSEGIFYAKLICSDGLKEVQIDSRTSDAIALAVRFNCPVFTYEFILSSAGIVIDESEESEPDTASAEEEETPVPAKSAQDPLSELSDEELKNRLQKAVEDEAYEKASQIQAEINRRKQS
ncbi:MAG: bifunctional nuclease family protein [Flavobacteriales bacterium]|nr:bifunctional nuclease family protein [Flavobacteriales bacterium]